MTTIGWQYAFEGGGYRSAYLYISMEAARIAARRASSGARFNLIRIKVKDPITTWGLGKADDTRRIFERWKARFGILCIADDAHITEAIAVGGMEVA